MASKLIEKYMRGDKLPQSCRGNVLQAFKIQNQRLGTGIHGIQLRLELLGGFGVQPALQTEGKGLLIYGLFNVHGGHPVVLWLQSL